MTSMRSNQRKSLRMKRSDALVDLARSSAKKGRYPKMHIPRADYLVKYEQESF